MTDKSADLVLLEAITVNGGYFRHQPVIGEITFQLRAGEVLGISGLNGSGKSTVIKSVLGLTPYRSGTVKIFDSDVSNWSAERLFSRHSIGYLPQYERGFASLTIKENIVVARRARANISPQNLDSEREFHERFLWRFKNFKQYVGNLSGGERTRVALYCLVVSDPEIIFLDEPSAGADAEVLAHLKFIIDSWKLRRRAVLLIEQNQTFLDATATHQARLIDEEEALKAYGYTLRYLN